MDKIEKIEKVETLQENRVEKVGQTNNDRNISLKMIVLTALVFQKVTIDLSMKYSRVRSGDRFISSTAVAMPEVVKLIVSLILVYWKECSSWKHFKSQLHNMITKEPLDTLKVCIPSLIYVVQNNLKFIAVENLDAPIYQVTSQLKIFTTAIFSVILLKFRLTINQWSALALLVIGIFLVEITASNHPSSHSNSDQNFILGLSTSLLVCCLSGFASVYFEKILKKSDISIWIRNIQLSSVSIPLAFITCFAVDWKKITDKGFFHGYDLFVVFLICLQATGGIIVALVIKYADNIIKGFTTSISISLGCIFSVFFFNFVINIQFIVGAVLVMLSIFLYSYTKKKKPAIQMHTNGIQMHTNGIQMHTNGIRMHTNGIQMHTNGIQMHTNSIQIHTNGIQSV